MFCGSVIERKRHFWGHLFHLLAIYFWQWWKFDFLFRHAYHACTLKAVHIIDDAQNDSNIFLNAHKILKLKMSCQVIEHAIGMKISLLCYHDYLVNRLTDLILQTVYGHWLNVRYHMLLCTSNSPHSLSPSCLLSISPNLRVCQLFASFRR